MNDILIHLNRHFMSTFRYQSDCVFIIFERDTNCKRSKKCDKIIMALDDNLSN